MAEALELSSAKHLAAASAVQAYKLAAGFDTHLKPYLYGESTTLNEINHLNMQTRPSDIALYR